MKKYLLILLLAVLSFPISAQVINFRTQSFTYKQRTSYGWTDWATWQSSNMLITFDLNSDIITIYSPNIQRYKIIDYLGESTDRDGDHTKRYRFYDQDGDIGTMRLVMRRSGRSEIYIDFSNIIWTYTVIRL